MEDSRIGVWLIGAKRGGGVDGHPRFGRPEEGDSLGDIGLVSQLPQFRRLGLIDWERLVVGGHDIRRAPLLDGAVRMAQESRHTALPAWSRNAATNWSRSTVAFGRARFSASARRSPLWPTADVPRDETPREAIARLGRDMAEFVRAEGLAHLMVVNVASTEPAVDASNLPPSWAELER